MFEGLKKKFLSWYYNKKFKGKMLYEHIEPVYIMMAKRIVEEDLDLINRPIDPLITEIKETLQDMLSEPEAEEKKPEESVVTSEAQEIEEKVKELDLPGPGKHRYLWELDWENLHSTEKREWSNYFLKFWYHSPPDEDMIEKMLNCSNYLPYRIINELWMIQRRINAQSKVKQELCKRLDGSEVLDEDFIMQMNAAAYNSALLRFSGREKQA